MSAVAAGLVATSLARISARRWGTRVVDQIPTLSLNRAPRDDAAKERGLLPHISVIIPTFNRAAILVDTLNALLRQDYPAERLEIIIVDNSSSDNTEEVVREAHRGSRCPLFYHRKENRGPAASRNYGIARARGEIVAFTDSDCRPCPGWLRAGVSAFGPGIGLVSGPIRPVFHPNRPVGHFYHQIDEVTAENPLYPSANVFFSKAVLQEMGGFDERFGVRFWGSLLGGEDTDLAWRAKRAGHLSAFAPAARVDHEATRVSIGRWLVEPFRSEVLPILVAQFPELREKLLWRRYFVYHFTLAFYFAVAGVLLGLTTKFMPAFAALLPLLYLMRGLGWQDINNPRRWWRILARYALHLYRLTVTIAGLWYGSIRARTLVI